MTKYAKLGGENSAQSLLLYNESSSSSSDENEQPETSKMDKNGRKINNCDSGKRIPKQHCHNLLLQQKENEVKFEYRKDKLPEILLKFLALVSMLYLCVQFTGGILANSLAIIADCGHVLTDMVSFLISIYMIRISKKPASRRYSFGLLRAEIIGALCSLFIIWTITCLMVVFATQRIVAGKFDVEANIMIITALIGICFNLFMAFLLKFSKFSPKLMMAHSHGHSHSLNNFNNTSIIGRNPSTADENVNIRAAFIHVFGDLIQSISVLLAAFCIRWTGFALADPLCTYLFSLIVFCTSIPVAMDIFSSLMEATPKHFDHSKIARDLLELDLVRGIHSLHIWSLNTSHFAASVHLIVEDGSKSIAVTSAATNLLQHKLGIHFTTIQIEEMQQEDKHFECNFCQENNENIENDVDPFRLSTFSSFTSPFSEP